YQCLLPLLCVVTITVKLSQSYCHPELKQALEREDCERSSEGTYRRIAESFCLMQLILETEIHSKCTAQHQQVSSLSLRMTTFSYGVFTINHPSKIYSENSQIPAILIQTKSFFNRFSQKRFKNVRLHNSRTFFILPAFKNPAITQKPFKIAVG
ncbi:MAG: hypothetical protein LPK19_06775, partial [Hymenobacteraceae bacterium]|nr:hypothetical protein [Hymenobacteraceae bacterium]MDX5511963.1 hypothetical protein [Hymenobacteraceae bacterium]